MPPTPPDEVTALERRREEWMRQWGTTPHHGALSALALLADQAAALTAAHRALAEKDAEMAQARAEADAAAVSEGRVYREAEARERQLMDALATARKERDEARALCDETLVALVERCQKAHAAVLACKKRICVSEEYEEAQAYRDLLAWKRPAPAPADTPPEIQVGDVVTLTGFGERVIPAKPAAEVVRRSDGLESIERNGVVIWTRPKGDQS